jgi:hypothetical protein
VLRRLLCLAVLLLLALPAGNAMAGRLVVTGHDADRGKNKTVKAGHRYFARAPKLRRRKH